METTLALVLGFIVGFLLAGYIHYRKCRKSGMTRAQSLSNVFGIVNPQT